MYPPMARSYIVPAIFLNPVLFLISINTILSRLLPPITVHAAIQPPPYTKLGPSPEHPYLDIHTSEGLCWSYTILIVCAQLVAFGRVSGRSEEGTARAIEKKRRLMVEIPLEEGRITKGMDGARIDPDGAAKRDVASAEDEAYESYIESDL